jgi:hypothetical protein
VRPHIPDISNIEHGGRAAWWTRRPVDFVFAIGWPVDTLFLLGIVLAIDLTFQGVSSIAFGLALKEAATPH